MKRIFKILKQKDIFEELTSNRKEEIQDLSKQIDCDNLTYKYKSKTAPKNFIVFIAPLNFYKNIKEVYVTLENAEEKQK